MKLFSTLFLSFICTLPAAAHAANFPSFDLEKKIAYQQGQFGALYARCGSVKDVAVIGGSLVSWRNETFMGYKGTADERAKLERTFDGAAADVNNDETVCKDWLVQASATWHSINYLTRYGLPVIANP